MAIRMKDIANELGISVVTVSKVINNHRDISPSTRERVLRRIKELNYRPSIHAQGLAFGRTLMVGLVVPDLIHAFFSEVAQSISSVIRKKGYSLLVASSDEDPELEKQEIQQMILRRVDVLIVASCQTNPATFRNVVKEKVPLILIDRSFSNFDAPFVGTDDVLIGELATDHLIGLGRHRIAHISGHKVSTSKDRLEGYKRALARHRIPFAAKYVMQRSLGDKAGDESGQLAMEKLLLLDPRPDAVFCYNDPAAIGAMNAILAAGLRIPEDIAVVGSGNIRYAESLRVPLSSVDVPRNSLGEQVGELALKLTIPQKDLRNKKIIIHPRLIIRESSRDTQWSQAPQTKPRRAPSKSGARLRSAL
jgi:LacI family transcriptional regulator